MATALIIEDNPDNMLLICDILEFNNYSQLKAETGLQGVAIAKEQHPDFILLDIQLPDIDGYEVLERIKADEETRSIPVVAMTSYAMAGDREKLLSAGCDGYIEKPINPSQVMGQIQEAIEK